MRPPLLVRSFTPDEANVLRDAAGSDDLFARKRAVVLRLSAQRRLPHQIADALALSPSGVRHIIHDFHARGLESVSRRPMGPANPERLFDAQTSEHLVALAHQSPRAFGKPRSTWTLPLLAEVAFEEGLTPREVSDETVRQALRALGHSWQRAKHWIRSPDPQYTLKKNSGIV